MSPRGRVDARTRTRHYRENPCDVVDARDRFERVLIGAAAEASRAAKAMPDPHPKFRESLAGFNEVVTHLKDAVDLV
jgi:hypothetical protein